MSKSVRENEQKAEVNLTPILDMVFQLITFFMMVINFKAAAIDENLKLPFVGSARPVPEGENVKNDLLVLNVGYDKARNGYFLKVYKKVVENVEGYIAAEAQASLLASKMTTDQLEEGKWLPTRVVIRADKATPFKALNRVIKACQENGYRNFAMKTAGKRSGDSK